MKKGLVIKSTGSRYTVKLENNQITLCTLKGKFRKEGMRSTNPVAVGDYVEVMLEDNKETGIIVEIQERKNYIIRKSTNLSKESHIIAANVDQALLVVTLVKPKTTTLFIDRFLLSAEAYRIPVVLVFNKTDLYNEKENALLEQLIKTYKTAGYQCVKASVKNNINLDLIKHVLKDKVSVIAGNSGVGKSTIINAIDGNLKLKIGEISNYHLAGKHTTTFAEMHPLSFGGYIIDTPGIKGFGLIDVQKDEIYHFFPEIFKHSKHCEYYNCLHIQEPGCAVRKAAEKGEIGISRYNNYLNIYLTIDSKYR